MKKLEKKISYFVQERNWEQFHSPKNLAMALSVEVAELVEIFQWMEGPKSHQLDEKTLAHLEEEIGDIMIYLSTLAMKFGLDPLSAAHKKMVLNAKKYPAD
ncbi:MAG: nucleotide pyrophosphohydrolase [Thermodesulfobacteriota bacterium]